MEERAWGRKWLFLAHWHEIRVTNFIILLLLLFLKCEVNQPAMLSVYSEGCTVVQPSAMQFLTHFQEPPETHKMLRLEVF